ncbi:hypothetical protein KJ656_00975, partial [bacterium]|nr:hypothetical protein [bacterium]
MANVIYYPDKNEIKDKDYKEPQIPELKTNKDKENIRSFVAKNRSSSRLKKGIAVELYVTDKTIARKSKQWLAKIHPYNQHEMALNPDK